MQEKSVESMTAGSCAEEGCIIYDSRQNVLENSAMFTGVWHLARQHVWLMGRFLERNTVPVTVPGVHLFAPAKTHLQQVRCYLSFCSVNYTEVLSINLHQFPNQS